MKACRPGDRSPGGFICSSTLFNISVLVNKGQPGFVIKVLDDLKLRGMNETLDIRFRVQITTPWIRTMT